MKVLYRRPKCSSVIERSTGWDELARLAPERTVFECGICGNIMPGAAILSGTYDLAPDEPQIRPWKVAIREWLRKLTRPSPAPIAKCEIPFLHDVLAELTQEHKGQTKLWPGPVLPSEYRGIVSSTQYSDWKPPMRLQEIGTTFHEEVPLRANDGGKQGNCS